MVAIALRTDFTSRRVRTLAVATRNAKQSRRLLAIAAVYDGMSRAAAAEIGGMDRQTLRDWVHRFNAEGPDGLIDRTSPGAPSRLTAAQREELRALVEAGPDLARDGVVRWRAIDLKAVIRRRFGVDYAERTVCQLLNGLGLSHISARPQAVKQDPRVQEAFKKTSPSAWPRS